MRSKRNWFPQHSPERKVLAGNAARPNRNSLVQGKIE